MRVELRIAGLEEIDAFAARLAAVLRPGDVIILTGDLGAGKTTFTQFLAGHLGVRGRVSSPTFVIAREHAPAGAGPGLVHVDAYRLDDSAEFADLDLGADLAESVTVIEWGHGIAEELSAERLEITLVRAFEEDGSGTAGPDSTDTGPGDPAAGAPIAPEPLELDLAEEDESRLLVLESTGPGWDARLALVAEQHGEPDPGTETR
ncbi:tRNA (adenosine(37)-N6)-threonylcarbamoyltransferase complex ATPase subunit type 1 TsaE [Brevibacterium sp. R8603A2]|uniref:tRNA (adenosine(37)-N6)-threonylcarbamoyltransferase complex ATPase subunit type 1 TsaE n=1 Tax=Brevibacterium sp. R8603A2 TaxID=2929779 RepID=UPI001FF77AB1|nr:tRNA (adenosine(37)-N6)-threonylcarbamoyltransferase complex ATPase subunit type 1 TsaE [Brevibacterium sp. R8603A2]MCK1801537.1 tRNA (adenosine(37)-N6)-threonylcarbamoyltransferase complex ATPase subunit type 1 TsaE [Brevibacterium sp. R8603A2]